MLYTYIFYKYFSVSELSAISTYPVSARVLYSPVHDFAELDVFLGQHCWRWNNILIQKCNIDHFPTPKLNQE